MKAISWKAYDALEALAYRIADNNYMIERYGYKDTEYERAQNHKTIMALFDDLDTLGVPWALQNSIIVKYENWRLYKSTYFRTELEKLGYTREV